MSKRNIFFPLVCGLCLSLAMVIGLWFTPSITVMAQNPTQVPTMSSQTLFSLAVSNPSVNVGDTFDLNVTIETDQESRSAQTGLSFDPNLVEIVDLVEGDFYKTYAKANGATTLLFPQKMSQDTSKGLVAPLGVSIMGGPTTGSQGMKGKGILLTYHVKAKANGQAKFKLENIRIFDNGFSGTLMGMGGVKASDLIVPIGGGQAVQGTAESQQPTQNTEPTVEVRATATPEGLIGGGGGSSSFPWLIGIPILGVIGIAVAFVLNRKK